VTAPTLTRRVGPLTRTDFVRYAGAGGDLNPMHHDETFAVAAGYPSVFGHGLLTAGILSSSVVEWLGLDRLRRFAVRYADQVWPGDVLEVTGEPAGVTETGAGTEQTYRLTVHADDGRGTRRLVLTGSAVALVPALEEVRS
jgi:acyl dehydratase